MRSIRLSIFIVFCLAALAIASYRAGGARSLFPNRSMITEAPGSKKENDMNAYEVAEKLEWLNVSRPLKAEDLIGKIVLIDFWTYCCINCIHILPDLKKLEAEFPNELVVVGSHSAKFDNERKSDHIREAILRYEIKHPVINDHEFKLWRMFGVNSWPSFVILDATGRYRGSASGEGQYNVLRMSVIQLIKEAKEKSLLKSTAIPYRPETLAKSDLSFPGKLDFDSLAKKVWISDSNHHRLLRSDLQGKVDLVVGSGRAGQRDGSFGEAEFFQPQGVVAFESKVYVADTSNHLIREIDLEKKSVRTIAGIGKQGYERNPRGPASKIPLASPWDLAIWKVNGQNILAVAMAGTHQIWGINLKTNDAMLLAGSGREDIDDGEASSASLAQPSGLYSEGDRLYFADSETSSLRYLENGKVHTLVGEGLFEFGLVDGKKPAARLQHAIGLTGDQDKIYIADTYNSAVRVFDLKTNLLSTFTAKGLNEPNDVVVINGALWVADTNHHEIKKLNLETKASEKIVLKFSETTAELKPQLLEEFPFLPNLHQLEPQSAQLKDGQIQLKIHLRLPEGFKINQRAPSEWTLYSSHKAGLEKLGTHKISGPMIDVTSRADGYKEGSVDLSVYYCPESESELAACKIKSFRIPISKTGREERSLELTLD